MSSKVFKVYIMSGKNYPTPQKYMGFVSFNKGTL